MGVFYTSRENVMQALDIRAAAYTASRIDRAIDSASRNVEGFLNGIFYPLTATKYFDYPNGQMAKAGRLWLEGNQLISVSSFVSGGTIVPPANYFLEPNEYGPPYDRIDINIGTNSALTSNQSTGQRSLVVTGLWMSCVQEEGTAGTLTTAISTTTATTLTVTGANVGVGRILRIDTERFIVTEKNFVTSGQTGTLTSNLNANTLAVADSTVFALREELLIDAERVQIVDIAGNNLIVRRATGGSTLAAHTGSTIFFARLLTVTRGALGTVAATHLINAPIFSHLVPALVEELTVAYALMRQLNELSGFAHTISSGSSQSKSALVLTVKDLEDNVKRLHGRYSRVRAV
jgi:hypothetical protein